MKKLKIFEDKELQIECDRFQCCECPYYHEFLSGEEYCDLEECFEEDPWK